MQVDFEHMLNPTFTTLKQHFNAMPPVRCSLPSRTLSTMQSTIVQQDFPTQIVMGDSCTSHSMVGSVKCPYINDRPTFEHGKSMYTKRDAQDVCRRMHQGARPGQRDPKR